MARWTTPNEHAVEFGVEYYGILNNAIANRMLALGVPKEMIGFKYYGIDTGAFVRYPAFQIGGNINPNLFAGRAPAINIDFGVLMTDHPVMVNVPTWGKASLLSRVDAAIAHEHTEALANPMSGLDFHQQVLKFASATALPITSDARQILIEYRRAQGQ